MLLYSVVRSERGRHFQRNSLTMLMLWVISCHYIMTRKAVRKLQDKKSRLLAKLRSAPEVMKGSLAQVHITCGRKGCRCETGQRHAAHHFSYRIKGKSRSVCVPKQFVQEVRRRHAAWLELKRILEELSDVEVALFQAKMEQHRAAQKGG